MQDIVSEVADVSELVRCVAGVRVELCSVYGFALSNANGVVRPCFGADLKGDRCTQYVAALRPAPVGGPGSRGWDDAPAAGAGGWS